LFVSWSDALYVCVCNAVTDREIRSCADLGVVTLEDLRVHIGVASCCGRCAMSAEQVLREHAAQRTGREPAAVS
jgi:bacterioferritin-associated ferredoxin